jgi:hypothetical protein
MQEMFANPAVQGGLAPFIAALIVAALLAPIRLGGLAVVAAFATAVYFIAGFTFSPLTATRKIILLGLAAPLAGIVIDFALRPTRLEARMLALAGAGAAAWIFWPVLVQMDLERGLLLGSTAVLATAWTIGFSHSRLAEDGVRAGAAGLALGAGTGAAAILGASLTYGLYGFAVAAGSGAFLLMQMITGKKIHAGATFMFAATVVTMLLAAATMILAQLPWYAVLALALVPVAASLPLRAGVPVWLQALLLSICGLVVAGIACALAWHAGG